MKLIFAEKTFFSRCKLSSGKKKLRYSYDPLHSEFLPLFIRLCQNNTEKKIQSTINVGKNKSVVQDSYAYLLTCHCNLISVKKLKSPEITATFDNLSNTVIAF